MPWRLLRICALVWSFDSKALSARSLTPNVILIGAKLAGPYMLG
jgi:hypothetical protein